MGACFADRRGCDYFVAEPERGGGGGAVGRGLLTQLELDAAVLRARGVQLRTLEAFGILDRHACEP